MGFPAFFAVITGGAIGTWLRWVLGLALNPLFPNLPLGTLAVNLIGGFVIGVAVGVFGHFQTLPLELRLFVMTGLCGGLTTFSAFSAETAGLILRQELGWTFAIIAAHVLGSLAMTLLGIGLVRLFASQ